MLGMAQLHNYGKIKEDTIFDLQENSKDEYEAEEDILMYIFVCVYVPMSTCGGIDKERERETKYSVLSMESAMGGSEERKSSQMEIREVQVVGLS